VGKLYAFLVSETAPPKSLLAPLAEQLRGSNYSIANLVKTILGSRLFYSEHAYRKRVKWPVECALGAIAAAVPDRVPLSDVVDPLSKMGQTLFSPPNVKGWRTGTDWLNSATLLARNNFTEKVALGTWNPSRPMRGGNAFAFTNVEAKVETTPVESPPPPPPDAKFDVCTAIYASKPKSVGDVIAQMAVVLYGTGDAVPASQMKKIETFLLMPGPVPAKAPAGASMGGTAEKDESIAPKAKPDVKKKPVEKAKEEPKKTQPKPLDPKDVKLDSPEFKARVREAFHAMMCLPEYQLD
jgi:hypothetical protein